MGSLPQTGRGQSCLKPLRPLDQFMERPNMAPLSIKRHQRRTRFKLNKGANQCLETCTLKICLYRIS